MFSPAFKFWFEKMTIYLGIFAFVSHAGLILLLKLNILNPIYFPQNLFGNPFAALFSPFSSLLIYEVYLLIYYLRESYTKSVSKQLEIMALILLRNGFKDIGDLTQGKSTLLNSALLKDLFGFIVVLIFLWLFQHINSQRPPTPYVLSKGFINLKERMSFALMIIFLGLSFYSFSNWLIDLVRFSNDHSLLIDPSHIFYTEFFTLLTFADVLLLLSSAKNLQNSMLIIRNSGYVLATFLMRISFSLNGWERVSTVILGAGVAVFMLWISRREIFLKN